MPYASERRVQKRKIFEIKTRFHLNVCIFACVRFCISLIFHCVETAVAEIDGRRERERQRKGGGFVWVNELKCGQ